MKATYISHYLSDHDVANFARQSFARVADEFTEEQNHNLIRFLARGMSTGDWNALLLDYLHLNDVSRVHDLAVYLRNIPDHWAPFGHPHISLRMSAPVPIRTQCFKHKIGFVESEESRRYISSTPELFIPDYFRSAAKDKKQGSGGIHPDNNFWKSVYIDTGNTMIQRYMAALKDNVCPEQARFFLPQGVKVNWVWTGSLYAYTNLYNQRSNFHAQKEIQDLVEQVKDIIEPLYPVSWNALTQGAY